MSEKLAKLMQQQEHLRAQIQRQKTRESAARRRADTRRKIVLGGALLAVMKRDPTAGSLILSRLQTVMSEKDKSFLEESSE